MKHWAITIGLNHYQHFQPLSFAQQDAQAFQDLLIQQAGFAPENCLLLTDNSPALWGRSTVPTYANLVGWIQLLADSCLKPDDRLWLFFSGYGVCQHGVDYWVPLDGHPQAIAETCIPIVPLLTKLEAHLGLGTSLALMDMSRIQSAVNNEVIGMQLAQYTYQAGIATILSCQPGQYSREISSLGHGLFTVALLESLRYEQGATLATLVRFLTDRVPELSQYYYQPTQTPFPICPAKRLHKPLLALVTELEDHTMNGHGASNNGHGASNNGHRPNPVTTPFHDLAQGTEAHLSPTASAHPQAAPVATTAPPQAAIATNGHSPRSQPNPPPFSRNGATAPPPQPPAVPLDITTQDVTANHRFVPNSCNSPTGSVMTTNSQAQHSTPPTTAATAPTPAEDQADGTDEVMRWHPMLGWVGLLSLGLIGCVLWRNWALLGTPTQAAQTPTLAPASAPAPPIVATTAIAPVLPAPVPPTEAAVDGQTRLNAARKLVLSDQATPYRTAIDAAKQIPPTDPAYAAAQADIANWSQMIYEIGQQRARQNQWKIAIMAMDQIPADNLELRPQALNAIEQWCPAVRNQAVVDFESRRAKEICQNQPF